MKSAFYQDEYFNYQEIKPNKLAVYPKAKASDLPILEFKSDFEGKSVVQIQNVRVNNREWTNSFENNEATILTAKWQKIIIPESVSNFKLIIPNTLESFELLSKSLSYPYEMSLFDKYLPYLNELKINSKNNKLILKVGVLYRVIKAPSDFDEKIKFMDYMPWNKNKTYVVPGDVFYITHFYEHFFAPDLETIVFPQNYFQTTGRKTINLSLDELPRLTNIWLPNVKNEKINHDTFILNISFKNYPRPYYSDLVDVLNAIPNKTINIYTETTDESLILDNDAYMKLPFDARINNLNINSDCKINIIYGVSRNTFLEKFNCSEVDNLILNK